MNGQPFFTKRRLIIAGIVYAVLLLVFVAIVNLPTVNHWLGNVLRLFSPILAGLLLAYLLNPVFRFFERKALRNVHHLTVRRILSLICTYLFLLILITLLLLLIIPQLISSITSFVDNYSEYLSTALGKYNEALANLNRMLEKAGTEQNVLHPLNVEDVEHFFSEFVHDSKRLTEMLQQFVSMENAGQVIGAVSDAVSKFINAILAFFISLYLLATKEHCYAWVMKLRRGLFGDRVNAAITRFCTVADRSFGSFLEGKMLDSLIIGVLCYIVLLIFKIPYPVLIAAIIGITNVVPFIGPIFGAIPTAVIILLTDPGKVIPFLLIVLVIQQIDGNIIGPKILGSSNGVSSLCVLIAITTMGSIWGLAGMILGVPLFATVIELVSDFLENRLRERGLPSSTENYYPADSMVDPAQDVQGSSEKTLRRFERNAMRLQRREERGEKLSRWNRMVLRFYRFSVKTSMIPEVSAETLTQFAAEEAMRQEEQRLRREVRERKHPEDADASH